MIYYSNRRLFLRVFFALIHDVSKLYRDSSDPQENRIHKLVIRTGNHSNSIIIDTSTCEEVSVLDQGLV